MAAPCRAGLALALRVPSGGEIIAAMKRDETISTIDAQYVCTFRPEPEGGYTVRCSAFPEIVSYGASLQEARQNAREALELCIEVYRVGHCPRQTPIREKPS
jgi:predicted RNase H-like HicB family nuclease